MLVVDPRPLRACRRAFHRTSRSAPGHFDRRRLGPGAGATCRRRRGAPLTNPSTASRQTFLFLCSFRASGSACVILRIPSSLDKPVGRRCGVPRTCGASACRDAALGPEDECTEPDRATLAFRRAGEVRAIQATEPAEGSSDKSSRGELSFACPARPPPIPISTGARAQVAVRPVRFLGDRSTAKRDRLFALLLPATPSAFRQRR